VFSVDDKLGWEFFISLGGKVLKNGVEIYFWHRILEVKSGYYIFINKAGLVM
jgi:hypothetical protein